NGTKVQRIEKRPAEPVESAEASKPEAAALDLPACRQREAPVKRSLFELRPSRLAVGQIEASAIEGEQVPLGPAALADNARVEPSGVLDALLPVVIGRSRG